MTFAVLDALSRSEKDLLSSFAGNSWFRDTYWPMNRPRLIRMLTDATHLSPPLTGHGRRTLADIGCGNGYMSYVFATAGYNVVGVDGYPDEERDRMFREAGIEYVACNFNHPGPLHSLATGRFDVVLCGEVLEHILNCPQEFVQELHRITRPGGIVIVTTPNPSTVMNAIRTLRDRHSMWGTEDFITLPKFENNSTISHAGIHYREYSAAEVSRMLRRSGLEIIRADYVGSGPNAMDGWLKRLVKRVPGLTRLLNTRLCATTHYRIGRRIL